MTSSQVTSRTNRSIAPFTSRTTGSSVSSLASTQRRLHRKEFPKFYADLCHLQHSHPLNAVKIFQDRSAVDIQGDRIKFDEWYPIISALSWDQSLRAIAIRLRHRVRYALQLADTDLKARGVTKQPVLTTKFVLYWMIESIKQCLTQSTELTVLELDGLPLAGEYLGSLAQALPRTRSLQHLSLYRSAIGDEGAEIVCVAVRDLSTLVTLDLSHCELGELGAMALSQLVTHQKLCRYSEAWKGTLRYRDPDVDAMPGLRRLTINNNPEIGDRGIKVLIEELRDDLWLRALDVQDTGLTEEGGTQLVHLIRNNPNLTIVDARCNVDLPEDILSEIMSLLAINNADKHESEYKWINRDNEVKVKTTTSRKIRPWGATSSIQGSSIRLSHKPSSICITGPVMKPPIARSHSSLGQNEKKHEQVQEQENKYLKEKLYDLTIAMNQEIKQKTQLMKENQELIARLQESEKKRSELEAVQKNVVSSDTLEILEKTLNRLTMMFPNGQGNGRSDDESDIPHLLTNINMLLKKGQPEEAQNPSVRTCKTERRQGRKRHEVNKQVIWEVDEENETISEDRRRNRNGMVARDIGLQKAQQLFAKLVMNGGNKKEKRVQANRGRRHIAEKPLTSSEEESSS